jgi:hypothetical protein
VEPWVNYTPYEWRNVGAMVRLGWRDQAQEALQWFMRYRRPPGFQHWAEVVWHDERAPRFIGDMPHTWCGTDYVRSVLDMLAYENEADSSLVIGAGVPAAWLEGDGVVVKGLHTRWGALSYRMWRRNSGLPIVEIDGSGLRMPPGGVVLMPPVPAGRACDVVFANQSGLGIAVPNPARVVVRSFEGQDVRQRIRWEPHDR